MRGYQNLYYTSSDSKKQLKVAAETRIAPPKENLLTFAVNAVDCNVYNCMYAQWTLHHGCIYFSVVMTLGVLTWNMVSVTNRNQSLILTLRQIAIAIVRSCGLADFFLILSRDYLTSVICPLSSPSPHHKLFT